MNSGSKRFRAIQRLAERKERNAATVFGEQRRERDEARRRLQDLEGYRQEYLARYADAMRAGAPAVRLRDYQSFIDKLEHAMEEQRRILAEQEKRCAQAKAAWSSEYTQVRAIGNVVENKRIEEARQEARREQKALDDRGRRRD